MPEVSIDTIAVIICELDGLHRDNKALRHRIKKLEEMELNVKRDTLYRHGLLGGMAQAAKTVSDASLFVDSAFSAGDLRRLKDELIAKIQEESRKLANIFSP